MKKNVELPLLVLFSEFVRSSEKGKRRTKSGKKIAPGTLELYRHTEKLLCEYEKVHHLVLRLKPLYRGSIVQTRQEKNYWEKFFRNFFNYLYHEKMYFDQFAGTIFKILRTFFNYVLVEKALPTGQFYKHFRIPSEKWTPVVLTPAQLKYLISNHDFRHRLPSHLQRTLDIFIFGCTVGLRWSDLINLKRNNILVTPEGVYLTLYTQKTGASVRIPLPDYVLDIIKRYKAKAGNYIFPRLSCSNMNLQIKQIIEKCGWTYILPKYRHRQGKIIELRNRQGHCFRFCDHITAHTMRRTAITTLLILGVPEMVVRKISGHAAGSQEFYRYVAIAQDYLEQEVKKAFSLLTPEYKKQD